MEEHPADPLTEVGTNARSVLAAAEHLFDRGFVAPALHLAIICWEECAKYLLAYCKAHIPEEEFERRFNHKRKIDLASVPYFIVGGLSMIFAIERLHRAGLLGGDDQNLAVIKEDLLGHIGWGNPQRLAQIIMERLYPSTTAVLGEDTRKESDRVESLRRASVYVDLEANLEVRTTPRQISIQQGEAQLETARAGVALLDLLENRTFDLDALIAKLPKSLRDWTISDVDKLVASIQQKSSKRSPGK